MRRGERHELDASHMSSSSGRKKQLLRSTNIILIGFFRLKKGLRNGIASRMLFEKLSLLYLGSSGVKGPEHSSALARAGESYSPLKSC